jgi:hypothetical protein
MGVNLTVAWIKLQVWVRGGIRAWRNRGNHVKGMSKDG